MLSCTLTFEKPAKKSLDSLPRNASERIWRRPEELAQNPLREERLKGRLKDLCKMHVGNYRVIYYLIPCNVIVIKAGRAFTRSSKTTERFPNDLLKSYEE